MTAPRDPIERTGVARTVALPGIARASAALGRIRSLGVVHRWGWLIALSLAVLIAGIGIAIFVLSLWFTGWPDFWYRDLEVLLDATSRLFAGEGWYLDRQLHGPYPHQFGEILYPPTAAWLFAPWLVLPAWTFIAIPLAIIGWHVADARPAHWTWALIAAGLTFPITLVHVGYGNPTTWMVACVGLGLRYRWPGALVLLKPSFLPFALIGIRARSWWLAAAGLAAASLPFVTDTLRYPAVVLDARGGGPLYSGLVIPFMLVPVWAWLGRRRHREARPA